MDPGMTTKADSKTMDMSKEMDMLQPATTVNDGVVEVVSGAHENADQLRRRLNNRQIQLMAIGGSIGTALFISIGTGLYKGGPLSLLLTYTFYSCAMALVNNCMAEMAVLQPVSGGFVRMAGKWVDDAFGFWAGYNFFIYEGLTIPFEITALNLVLTYWSDNIPAGAIIAACIVLYGSLNILAVKIYGEAEFWLSGGKVILLFIMFFFTFITMIGGNPRHDAYGFRYWKNPGPLAEFHSTGDLGRFEGLLGALWAASWTIVGPEYLSMVAAEAQRPRILMKAAFKTMYWRFGLFFILSAVCVGIVIPYNDKTLVDVVSGSGSGAGTAAASPYVIAMNNLKINGLPDLTNALLVTSIFSAGNTLTYCASRSLYGLALEGRAPKILRKCNKSGVPIYAIGVTMLFPFLSFLELSSSSSVALTWFTSLNTAGQVLNFIIILTTYTFFYRACKAQGVDRSKFPYCGWFQPYGTWFALGFEVMVITFFGYSSFTPWSVESFFQHYAMVILAPILFFGWKWTKKTKSVAAKEADLVWEAPLVTAYEETFTDKPAGFWREMYELFVFKKLWESKHSSNSDDEELK